MAIELTGLVLGTNSVCVCVFRKCRTSCERKRRKRKKRYGLLGFYKKILPTVAILSPARQ